MLVLVATFLYKKKSNRNKQRITKTNKDQQRSTNTNKNQLCFVISHYVGLGGGFLFFLKSNYVINQGSSQDIWYIVLGTQNYYDPDSS